LDDRLSSRISNGFVIYAGSASASIEISDILFLRSID
jgi:hypothetical protein